MAAASDAGDSTASVSLPFDTLNAGSNKAMMATMAAKRAELCHGVDLDRVREEVVFSSALTKVNRFGSKQ